MKEFDAVVVDWSVGFESERDEGVCVGECCVLDLLSAGRPIRRAARTRRREVLMGVGDGIGHGDVPGDVFSTFPWDERHAFRSLAVFP